MKAKNVVLKKEASNAASVSSSIALGKVVRGTERFQIVEKNGHALTAGCAAGEKVPRAAPTAQESRRADQVTYKGHLGKPPLCQQ